MEKTPKTKEYTVVFTENGDAQILASGKTLTFPKGMLLLFCQCENLQVHPSAGVRCQSISKGSLNAFFSYLGESGEGLWKRLFKAQPFSACVLSGEACVQIEKSFARLEKTEIEPVLSERFFVFDVLSKFAEEMLCASEEKDEIPRWLSAVCKKMELQENFIEGIPRMISLSSKTREHLARSMQKYKNITMSAFVNDLRLSFVANMLLTSDESIVDLCYDSGFTSLDYFGKQFKK